MKWKSDSFSIVTVSFVASDAKILNHVLLLHHELLISSTPFLSFFLSFAFHHHQFNSLLTNHRPLHHVEYGFPQIQLVLQQVLQELDEAVHAGVHVPYQCHGSIHAHLTMLHIQQQDTEQYLCSSIQFESTFLSHLYYSCVHTQDCIHKHTKTVKDTIKSHL